VNNYNFTLAVIKHTSLTMTFILPTVTMLQPRWEFLNRASEHRPALERQGNGRINLSFCRVKKLTFIISRMYITGFQAF
jgi:hypothetical protein